MKSTVSAGRSMNANVSIVPTNIPQTTEFCFEIQCFRPPTFQLMKWQMKNNIPITIVRYFISGRDSNISLVSHLAFIPMNVFSEGIRIAVSSTLNINQVMKTKYCVTIHPVTAEIFGAMLNDFLIKLAYEIIRWAINNRP